MNHEAGQDSQELRPISPCEFLPEILIACDSEQRPELSTAELAFRVLVAFRAHPHLSNVLTHISGANWAKTERSLGSILGFATTSDSLSPLEKNIVDLMCADRGITGQIMKPYFHAVLRRVLEPDRTERLIRRITALFVELEWKAQQPTCAAPIQNELPSPEPGHARSNLQ